MLALALCACQAAPQTSTLWLPLPETMAKIEYLDFHNDGPEVATLKAQLLRRIQGPERIFPGETVRISWHDGLYQTAIVP